MLEQLMEALCEALLVEDWDAVRSLGMRLMEAAQAMGDVEAVALASDCLALLEQWPLEGSALVAAVGVEVEE
jgi:hypothetical protein